MTTIKFKKLNIEAYKPGKSSIRKLKKIIKLSANESALGPSPKAIKEYIKVSKNFKRYPDSNGSALKEIIAKNFNLDKKKIILGSGSDEILELICRSFLKKNDEVIVPKFSFIIYRMYSKKMGAKVIFAKEENFKISIKNILSCVSKKTKIVFLANPNNPTGTYLTTNELRELREKLNNKILLVVDDAYFEYMVNKDYKSGLGIFKNSKNVFILRTFSKIYGLASLRIGWGYGDKKIVDELYKIKPPFNVNKIAQICAVEALKDKEFVKKSVKHNILWCKKIKKELVKYNISTNEIGPNFFLLNFNNCKISANKVEKQLEDFGIIVREMKSYGIKNSLRLTIGNTKENVFFLNKMKFIFKNV